jgi:hypothetical protein
MGANIFAPYIQQPKSVLDYVGEAEQRDMRGAQLQGLQRQNALAGVLMQQQMGDVQDKQARRNALHRVLSDPLITTPQAREEAMFKDPLLMDQGQAAQKARLDAEKLRADTSKSTAEADEKQWGLRVKKANTAITDIAALGSRDEAIASLTRHYQAGDIDQTKYQSVLATIPQDAAQFPAWRKQMLLRILDAKEQLEATKPVLQTNNTGGETVTQAIDPLTGVPTVTGRLKNTQSADNRATVGASLANAAAVRDAAKIQGDATRAAANAQRDQATEMKMADDYRAQSKEFGQAKSAHEQLTATLGSATTSPAATLAAATKFMKILDPGSVVRESELGMALAASGVLDRAANYVSTLQSGKKLTATQAADFKMVSNQMFDAAKKVQQMIDTDYQSKAKQYGLRPEMVTQDLGQNAGTVPPAVAAALARHGGK